MPETAFGRVIVVVSLVRRQITALTYLNKLLLISTHAASVNR